MGFVITFPTTKPKRPSIDARRPSLTAAAFLAQCGWHRLASIGRKWFDDDGDGRRPVDPMMVRVAVFNYLRSGDDVQSGQPFNITKRRTDAVMAELRFLTRRAAKSYPPIQPLRP